MDLMQLRSQNDWLALLDRIYNDTGMVASLATAEGKILLSSGERNPLCAAIREDEKRLTFVCSQTASAMTAELKVAKEPVLDFCDAGMMRLVVPVLNAGELAGQLSVCGHASPDEELDAFGVAQQLGVEEPQAQSLIDTVREMTEDELEAYGHALMKDVNG